MQQLEIVRPALTPVPQKRPGDDAFVEPRARCRRLRGNRRRLAPVIPHDRYRSSALSNSRCCTYADASADRIRAFPAARAHARVNTAIARAGSCARIASSAVRTISRCDVIERVSLFCRRSVRAFVAATSAGASCAYFEPATIVHAKLDGQVWRQWLSGGPVTRPRLLEELDGLCVVPDFRVDAAQKPEEIRNRSSASSAHPPAFVARRPARKNPAARYEEP